MSKKKFETPGSFVLAMIFLAWFVLAYFFQWAALQQNWVIY